MKKNSSLTYGIAYRMSRPVTPAQSNFAKAEASLVKKFIKVK
jgi:hypothetical protein